MILNRIVWPLFCFVSIYIYEPHLAFWNAGEVLFLFLVNIFSKNVEIGLVFGTPYSMHYGRARNRDTGRASSDVP